MTCWPNEQLQTIVREAGRPQVDRLADDDKRGVRFVVERPSFPHCFAAGPGQPGGSVKVRYERLVPSKPIHALLGADVVFNGVADAQGGGEIDLPIPGDAKAGHT